MPVNTMPSQRQEGVGTHDFEEAVPFGGSQSNKEPVNQHRTGTPLQRGLSPWFKRRESAEQALCCKLLGTPEAARFSLVGVPIDHQKAPPKLSPFGTLTI